MPQGDDTDPGPQHLTTVVAHQWQCDHFGHLNVRHYAAIFDDAIFVFWSTHGLGRDDLVVPVSADIRLGFRSEVLAGTVAAVRSRVARIGTKSVTVSMEMVDPGTGRVFATCEVVEVFFHRRSRESEPIPAPIRDSLAVAFGS